MPRARVTHTFAELQLSPSAYDEIASKLSDAGYDHAFVRENAIDEHAAIDMHGIGVTRAQTAICKSCVQEFDLSKPHECPGISTQMDHFMQRISYVTHEKKARGNYALTVGFLDLESVQQFHQWLIDQGRAIVDKRSAKEGL